MRQHIAEIIHKSLDGGLLTAEEISTLFRVEDLSEEGYAIRRAARLLTDRLMPYGAEIHGQIGLDIGSCPRDCKYCAFAVSTKVFPNHVMLGEEEVIEGVLSMEAQGANAIYLMATARYPFDQFIRMARAVRSAMKTEVPMIANVDDHYLDRAQEMADAGFEGVYHAIRMGEGEFTNITVDRRKKSIANAKAAGMKVGMCVEPCGPEHTIEELVEKTLLTRDLDAVFSGAMRRTTIPTSELAVHGQLYYDRMATIVAAVSLATGNHVAGNCTHEPNPLGIYAGANLIWAEVGSNPRDINAETVRGWTVNKCRELYQECGVKVLEGPSRLFRP